ncbi:hypothetical protein [Streptomyces sp. NRRL F-5630]|uniref:hypothetical protein n=1 Tax=Streptomyces sp. NRRL F-5630 TaxID=1463864 RepID=UPI003EBC45F1
MTDNLRDRIAQALEREDARNWGYDHGFENRYGVSAETDAFVDAVLAVLPSPGERATAPAQAADTIGLCGYCGIPRESHHHGYISTAAALAAAPHHISSESETQPTDHATEATGGER